MWILPLVEYSKGHHFYYRILQTISTDALQEPVKQERKNNRKKIINDAMCVPSIFSYLALSSPISTYVP